MTAVALELGSLTLADVVKVEGAGARIRERRERMGMSVRLSPQPALEEEVSVTIELPRRAALEVRPRRRVDATT